MRSCRNNINYSAVVVDLTCAGRRSLMEASMRKKLHPELCKPHNGMDDGAFEFSHRAK
jgi:hypothetical protein